MSGREDEMTPISVVALSDHELLEKRDILKTLKTNLHEQKEAWVAGDMIGYDQEWAGRLRGKISYTREELQVVTTELRRRGLLAPPTSPTPTPESRRWLTARHEALEAAMAEMLPVADVEAIKGLARNIYQEMRATADRNREMNGPRLEASNA